MPIVRTLQRSEDERELPPLLCRLGVIFRLVNRTPRTGLRLTRFNQLVSEF
jgi:hypothetical protein